MQGWASDVALLRKQMVAVDRRLRQMRLMERLPDDDRRDTALGRRGASEAGGWQEEGEASLEALAAEMAGLKVSLLEMAQRVRAQAEDALAG